MNSTHLLAVLTVIITMSHFQISGMEATCEKDISKKLEHCLMDSYRIPQEAAALIMARFLPLIESSAYHGVINEFIEKSQNILSREKAHVEGFQLLHDAVLKAAKWHEILYESPEIRVLWGMVKSGEQESSHMHYWKRLLVIVKGAKFEIVYADSTREIGEWPIGIYELPADVQPSTNTNVGTEEFISMSFEIK